MSNMIKETIKRAKAPTPDYFKKIIKLGVILGGAGAALLAAPIALPVAVTTVATYLVTAGTVAAAVGKLTVDHSAEEVK